MKTAFGNFDPSLFLRLSRALFPRWDFFDRIAHEFHLEIRSAPEDPWRRVGFSVRFGIGGLFVNPGVLLALAQINLIEHFAQEVQETPEDRVRDLTSYQLVASLAWVKADELLQRPTGIFFRVLASDPRRDIELFRSDFLRREDR